MCRCKMDSYPICGLAVVLGCIVHSVCKYVYLYNYVTVNHSHCTDAQMQIDAYNKDSTFSHFNDINKSLYTYIISRIYVHLQCFMQYPLYCITIYPDLVLHLLDAT